MSKILVVGAGCYGAAAARVLHDAGHDVKVIDRRDHVGGNCHTPFNQEAGCFEHRYGAHIFHTNNPAVWKFVTSFGEFNDYRHRVAVNYRNQLYSFPINLLTLSQVFGVALSPTAANALLASLREPLERIETMEDQLLATVGRELYGKFFEGYTRKQWGKHPREIPASIARRIPVRLTYDDAYFSDRWQGIPVNGYTELFKRMLNGIPVETGCDMLKSRDYWLSHYDTVLFSGCIDEFFRYELGALEYRSLRFNTSLREGDDFQGCSVVNYTELSRPWTRVLEYKHFAKVRDTGKTLVTFEYPQDWSVAWEPFYPVSNQETQARYERYVEMAKANVPTVVFGGRLGSFRYYDMHQAIAQGMSDAIKILTK